MGPKQRNLWVGYPLLLPLFLLLMLGCSHRRVTPPQMPVAPTIHDELQQRLQQPYDELFDAAPDLKFTPKEFQGMREHVRQSQDYCTTNVKDRAKTYEKQTETRLAELKRLGSKIEESRRHDLHCQIQELRSAKAQSDVLADQLIPVAYDNSRAKLELLEKWPADYQQLQAEIKSEAYLNRRWGNVNEIGFREIEKDQKDDIKRGQDAIRDLQREMAMP